MQTAINCWQPGISRLPRPAVVAELAGLHLRAQVAAVDAAEPVAQEERAVLAVDVAAVADAAVMRHRQALLPQLVRLKRGLLPRPALPQRLVVMLVRRPAADAAVREAAVVAEAQAVAAVVAAMLLQRRLHRGLPRVLWQPHFRQAGR